MCRMSMSDLGVIEQPCKGLPAHAELQLVSPSGQVMDFFRSVI